MHDGDDIKAGIWALDMTPKCSENGLRPVGPPDCLSRLHHLHAGFNDAHLCPAPSLALEVVSFPDIVVLDGRVK